MTDTMPTDHAPGETAPLWGHIRPSDIAWEQFHDPHERPTTPVRVLSAGSPAILQASFPPDFHAGDHWHPFDTIYIFTAGEMRVGDEGAYRPGDIRWVRAGHVYGPEEAGPDGVEFFLVSLGGDIGLNWADLYDVPDELTARLDDDRPRWGRANLDELDWAMFDDPAGRPTTPVQVVAAEGPDILRTKFPADFVAGEHWHDFDTIYFILDGSMEFGPQEPMYEKGDIRWVRGGHAYGPEKPGPDGVDFLLVSVGGAVALHWSDLEPAPHGRLPQS